MKPAQLDISYKPLSAFRSLYIAVIPHMVYRIWGLFPYMKHPVPNVALSCRKSQSEAPQFPGQGTVKGVKGDVRSERA